MTFRIYKYTSKYKYFLKNEVNVGMGNISSIQRMQTRYYGWELHHLYAYDTTGDTSN